LLKKASDVAWLLVVVMAVALTSFRDLGILLRQSLVSLGERTLEAEEGPLVLKIK
jgi:hypothetical protein